VSIYSSAMPVDGSPESEFRYARGASMTGRQLHIDVESWPVAGSFVISRGSRSEAAVVVARVRDGGVTGRGEAAPNPRYGETAENVIATLRTASRLTLTAINGSLPPGAARNALDCALWDLKAKLSHTSVWALAGLPPPKPVITAYTISLARPEVMAAKAKAAASMPLLKLKLGGIGDGERMAAVRAARPDARLVADANEAWTQDMLIELMMAASRAGVELIEQPLPAGKDAILAEIAHPVTVCADESVHSRADLERITQRYDAVNIKLDKAGGLTEALALRAEAQQRGLKVMVGCMLSTSLAMAPAILVAQGADWVDLDGPLLLAKDRQPNLRYDGAMLWPATTEIWG
jgi:L-alanine-DL-glutamate epimerase-like enolase superfamily enzyme